MENDIIQFVKEAGLTGSEDIEARRIGTDDAMVKLIIEVIGSGEKTMTYSLPWLAERDGRRPPARGRYIVVLGSGGDPRLLVRITDFRQLRFGDVSSEDIQREGVPMRDMAVWRPFHVETWNVKLAGTGREVNDDMPVWAEYFDLVYPLSRVGHEG